MRVNPPTGGKPFAHFIHIDAYRLKNANDIKAIGWDEIVRNPGNIIIVEWAEKIKKAIPGNAHWLHFSYLDEKTRAIKHRR